MNVNDCLCICTLCGQCHIEDEYHFLFHYALNSYYEWSGMSKFKIETLSILRGNDVVDTQGLQHDSVKLVRQA